MKNKYNIDPDFKKFPLINFSFSQLSLAFFNSLLMVDRLLHKPPADIKLNKQKIVSQDGSPFKIITMTPHNLRKNAPALIYCHGGGFALTYGGTHLQIAEHYASGADCVVIFVDYRLAPKHPFPSGFDDCYAALQWTIENANQLGIDTSRIAVGGDSAGGALAAGIAQKARDEGLANLCAQLLIYPVLDYRCDTPSATHFVDTPLWNAGSNRKMWQTYLSRYATDTIPDYASPGYGKLDDLPLSYIEPAEFDPLRDEAINYAHKLQQQGIKTILNQTHGTIHGFDVNPSSAISKEAFAARIHFLQEAFAQL
jgi:acetyl esterase/lipase